MSIKEPLHPSPQMGFIPSSITHGVLLSRTQVVLLSLNVAVFFRTCLSSSKYSSGGPNVARSKLKPVKAIGGRFLLSSEGSSNKTSQTLEGSIHRIVFLADVNVEAP